MGCDCINSLALPLYLLCTLHNEKFFPGIILCAIQFKGDYCVKLNYRTQ